jgi:hypothetical protein
MSYAKVTSVMAAAMLAASAAWAESIPVKAAVIPVYPVKTGRITGSILSADDDLSALAGTRVQFTNAAGQVVAATTTDAQGAFVIANLPEGRYTIDIGGLKGEILSTPQGSINCLTIPMMLIPPVPSAAPAPVPAPAPNVAPSVPYSSTGGFLGGVNWTTVAVSSGISVAVAVPASYGMAKLVQNDQTVSP